jgi:translation initiation factor IF-2
MSKYRIYELAKEFDTTSKVIIDILARNNISAKNHMSSVDDIAKTAITRAFARKSDNPVKAGTDARNGRSEQQNRPAFTNDRERPTQHKAAPHAQQARPAAQAPHPKSQSYQQQNQGRPVHQDHRPAQQNQGQRPNNQERRPFHQNQARPAAHDQRPAHSNQGRFNQQPNGAKNQQQGFRSASSAHKTDATTPRPQQDHPTRQHAEGGRPHYSGQNGAQRPRRSSSPGGNKKYQNNNRSQQNHNTRQTPAAKIEPPKPKLIKLGPSIAVKELASKLGREVAEIIKKLMTLGIMATINQDVDFDTATILAGEFGVAVEELPPEEDPTEIPEIEDDPASLIPRPPVVTVMGHVDHGKTSLLDAIRKTHVTAHEAGGITQHIGAYQVICQGKKIVFLDTPGHEAFTAMRARGAQVTDIAILVVAADDGVMPQTIEAINHAKSAKVPIIIAINKMDRPGANPDRVKQQLSEHGIIPEDWGGDIITVPVSAHQKTGISDLLEMILLVAEMQELKANPNRMAYGTIIEARLDKGRGPVATVLVQKGTLRIGDSIVAGTAYGKVRAMINDRGEKVKKAEPSTPVEVLGLGDVPAAGDVLAAVEEKIARAVAEKRIAKKRTDELVQSQKVSLDDLFKQIQEGNIKDLNIVIKADVQGSVEALRQSLLALNTNNKEVRVSVVHAGVGAINESDVLLASASNALIIGFNVRPDANARKAAETEKIDLRTYRVIYEAINDVEAAMTGMLAPEYKESVIGRAEIRKVFTINKNVVAGAYVQEGKVTSSAQIRIIRDGIVVHEGNLESLRRFKDDVKEVASGYECGLSIDKFRDIKEGDIVEAFVMEEVKASV